MYRAILSCVLFWLATPPVRAVDSYVFYHSNVIGTELELRLMCSSERMASAAEGLALQEIERLSGILSTYDPHSELNRWLNLGEESAVSRELREVLDASERWHSLTNGAFHPGVERLSRIWKVAETLQRLPSEKELSECVQRLKQLGWRWNRDRSAVKPMPATPLCFNAIAKGYIIDVVCSKLNCSPGIEGGLVAIGGDMRAFGQMKCSIGIGRPVDDLAAPVMTTIELEDHSIATSSGAFRGVTIDGKRFSHLLDPRHGYPAQHVQSVTVIAACAADADALATACSVLAPDESLELVNSLVDTACLIVDSNGQRRTSQRWNHFEKPALRMVTTTLPASAWNGGMELKIDFAIHQPDNGNRYRRPYVAIWLEDTDDFPVRTLVLWVQTSGPGPRWIPDLKRWYRSDRLRKLADGTDLIDTLSEATRKPSVYSVTWNGEDDNHKLVPPGEYTLYLEAAREHGTYQLIRKKILLEQSAFKETLDGNIEIKTVEIDYRKHLELK